MTDRLQPAAGAAPPVQRDMLFRSDLVEIRDNRCDRRDPGLSPDTPPMAFHEVCFPRRGLWCRHVGARVLAVDSTSVHFFPQGESHRVSHPIGCGDRNTGVGMHVETLREIAACGPDRSPFGTTHAPIDGRVFGAHRLLVRAVTAGAEVDGLRVEELSLNLVAAALRAADCQQREAEPAPRARRDLAHAASVTMARDLDQPMHIGDIAARVGVSPFHLARVFRRETGQSLHQYRLRLRLRAALELVLDTPKTLAAVAVETGFADRMHLSRQFARAFGQPPREWRASAGSVASLGLAGQLLGRARIDTP